MITLGFHTRDEKIDYLGHDFTHPFYLGKKAKDKPQTLHGINSDEFKSSIYLATYRHFR